MKIKFLSNYCAVFFFIFTASIVFSQTQQGTPTAPDVLPCKFVVESQSNICDSLFTHSTDQVYLDSFEPVVFNAYFWEFRNDDGSLDSDAEPMDFEKESLDVIAALNIFYNPYNVYFKYQGNDSINDSVLYDLYNGIFDYIDDYPNPSEVIVPDSFNIYVSDTINYGNAPAFNPKVVISRGKFKWHEDDTLHEVGHALGLLHTHENYHSLITGENCEHVTRDPLDIDDPTDPDDTFYNADIAGDRVTDTAATSPLLQESLGFDEVDEFTCLYIGDGTDCQGTLYQINPDDVHNIMGYTYAVCRDRVTVGQAIRMREAIEIDCYDKLIPAIRTDGFASLYKPYKGEYFEVGPQPTIPPLYQPGFSYNFISCDCLATNDCPLPLDYLDTGFTYNEQIGSYIHKEETNYSIITHPNHTAIRIIELEESQPWRCYDNNNRNPNGGTIIKFNDDVLNTNVTITAQDSMSINNENLINNLEPGLYNIIEQFENGDTEEQLIIKENN
jgi:hypothetical protein